MEDWHRNGNSLELAVGQEQLEVVLRHTRKSLPTISATNNRTRTKTESKGSTGFDDANVLANPVFGYDTACQCEISSRTTL
jgi:hypothetical protein